MVDPRAVDMEEQQLDQFIEHQGQKAKAECEREELYAESVRRFHEKRRRDNKEAWCAFHLHQAESIERTAAELAANHRARAEALFEESES
jgi:hypothetical protein